MRMPYPSLRRVLQYYRYNKRTGDLIRLIDSDKARAGTIAKKRLNNRHGYLVVSIDGRDVTAHRVAFAIVMRRWPKQIDHRNGIRTDNRWCNIREATHAQNMWNVGAKRTSPTGLKGASREGNRYVARIRVKGRRRIHIGTFDTPEEAHAAYMRAAKKYHGQFARAA